MVNQEVSNRFARKEKIASLREKIISHPKLKLKFLKSVRHAAKVKEVGTGWKKISL